MPEFDNANTRPGGLLSRRQALKAAGTGFGYLALAGTARSAIRPRGKEKSATEARTARSQDTTLSRQGKADRSSCS